MIREIAPGVRGGVSTLFALVAGVMTPGIALGKLPKDDGPVAGVRGSLGVAVPETVGGFVPKRGPGVTLESSVAGAASSLIPANRLGVVVAAASSALDFVSGFRPEPPSEKPVQPEPTAGGVAASPVTTEEVGLLLGGVPFAVSGGGDFGLGIKDGGTTLVAWSTDDSNFVGGGVGEGALAPPSHFPNGGFGDAGRGLSEAPFTSSSSPPDTGAFASGELRSGRVLGLPRVLLVELGDGDGVWEGDGSVGVGC